MKRKMKRKEEKGIGHCKKPNLFIKAHKNELKNFSKTLWRKKFSVVKKSFFFSFPDCERMVDEVETTLLNSLTKHLEKDGKGLDC